MAVELDHKSDSGVSIDGHRLRLEDLPPPGTKRWVIRRKAEVVAGVRAGLISLEEACARYTLSVEEFLSWQRSIDRHGMRGLRTTRLQDYRSSVPHAEHDEEQEGA
jgi:uncharacterized protein DUF1153